MEVVYLRPRRCTWFGHRWGNVVRTESIRYGVLVTRKCRRCAAERTTSR